MHEHILDARHAGQQLVFDGVRQRMAIANGHVAVNHDVNVDEHPQSALANTALLDGHHACDAGRGRSHFRNYLGGRRRGGRGRNRAATGEPVVQTAQDSPSGSGRAETQKPERKPRRERAPRVDTAAGKAAPEAASVAGLHKKPGFFNRIASFFGRH